MSLALGCPTAPHHWRQAQRGSSSVPRQHATRCCASRLQWRRGSLLPGQGPWQLLRGGVGPALAVPIVRSSGLAQKPRLTFVGAAGGSADGMSPDKTQFADKLADGNLRPPPISKPDAQFVEDMGLEFVYTREGIVLTELNDLFEKVGFPRRDIDKLRVALENTYHLIWIRSTKQSRLARMGQMVGFARATSDGVLSATIWDVAILPAWQRSGLGRALMERLTARLVQDDIPTITLYAEPHVVGLYEKLGFMKDPDGIRGMAFQRKKRSKAGQLQPALSR